MQKRTVIGIVAIVGGLFLLFTLMLYFLFSSLEGPLGGGERIAVVEIKGVLLDAHRYVESLYRFRKDRRIKAVVVRIDSPGGAVGPSQEIYREIRKYQTATKEWQRKPVVASMGSVAASGGMYIAAACPSIMSTRGTLTGSIGVIAQIPNYKGLLKWAKIDMRVLKAGKHKDTGSPFRQMSPEDEQLLKRMLQDVHQQFIEDVAKGRKLKKAKLLPIADGRVLTGDQAHKKGLVDRFGNLRDAISWAAKLAKIQGEPTVVYPRQRGAHLLGSLFQQATRGALRGALQGVQESTGLPRSQGIQLYYLWRVKGVIQ
jgi:protease IV